ncbi:hypothetical protein BDR07DRAFT_1083840 [Suillus spraguei]|nr:hypothetical protein BDR07DRAFT_1083840 [Suillus spraguei]
MWWSTQYQTRCRQCGAKFLTVSICWLIATEILQSLSMATISMGKCRVLEDRTSCRVFSRVGDGGHTAHGFDVSCISLTQSSNPSTPPSQCKINQTPQSNNFKTEAQLYRLTCAGMVAHRCWRFHQWLGFAQTVYRAGSLGNIEVVDWL